MKRQLKDKDALIEQLLDQINEMKSNFHDWVERAENGDITESSTSQNNVIEVSDIQEQTHVATIPIQQDESYFMSYAHFDIHFDMLSVSTFLLLLLELI